MHRRQQRCRFTSHFSLFSRPRLSLVRLVASGTDCFPAAAAAAAPFSHKRNSEWMWPYSEYFRAYILPTCRPYSHKFVVFMFILRFPVLALFLVCLFIVCSQVRYALDLKLSTFVAVPLLAPSAAGHTITVNSISGYLRQDPKPVVPQTTLVLPTVPVEV